MAIADEFLAGVIEGFYGKPWSQEERLQLFDWMKAWGLNTYFYAPKDDLKHRALWRELYSESEALTLRENIRACHDRGIRFIYGIAPGLDIRYSDLSELTLLERRFDQLLDLGCEDFAILFDDIPDQLSADDAKWFGSFAEAQSRVANSIFELLPEKGRFFFCPTPYCGRMAKAKVGGEGYLEIIGQRLAPDIDIFWTGPEIISSLISLEHIREVQQLLRRKPVIWDNLHANDYDGSRFYCGPYSGRPQELLGEVRGILSNPNNEFPLNFIPLRTLAFFLERHPMDVRLQYISAMEEWAAEFETIQGRIPTQDLILLGDCYYLPHQEGSQAERLLVLLRNSLRQKAPPPELARLKMTCGRIAELKNRALFYALHRRIWDLREELDLLERSIRGWGGEKFHSDFHLPKTFRGGFVPRLRTLLKQKPDGSFEQ